MDSSERKTSRPLTGIRVLDMTRVLAGPWAAQMLGDLGADVIKIERPGRGDDARLYGPAFLTDRDGVPTTESGFYLSANRNKRSITVDLSTAEGRDVIHQLARKSDVVIENYKVGNLARMGLDYEGLKALNPRLVYCSITGYGQTGPYAKRPGYDAVFQAQGGLMSVTGRRDGEPGDGPMKVGPSIVDVLTGYNAAIGVLAALRHRDISGEGQYIDLALLDVVVAAMSHTTAQYLTSGIVPSRVGDSGNGGGPSQITRCRDGSLFYFTCGNDGQFSRLCEILGRPDMPDDPMYNSLKARAKNWKPLRAILDELAAKFDRPDLEARMAAADVPSGAVNNLEETFADPQVLHRGLSVKVPHPMAEYVQLAANPIRMSASPVSYDRAPPTLGQHTDEVLAEVVGLDTSAIETLRERGVI